MPTPVATLTGAQRHIENLASSRLVDTVVIGNVKQSLGQVRIEWRPGQTGGIFHDWLVSVSQYVIKPLDQAELVVRTRLAYLHEGGRALAAKEAKLAEGLSVLLFLSRVEPLALPEERFEIHDAVSGLIRIEGSRVLYPAMLRGGSEPLDAVLYRIRTTADGS